jgi:biopolymer transport protein ExbB/TolQ
MDASVLAEMGLILTAITALLIGLNSLVGRGPRGTVWLITLCLFTWANMLPIVCLDPDGGPPSRQLEMVILLLQLSSIIGGLLSILDVAQHPRSEHSHPLAERLLRQPLLWGLGVCANFYLLLFGGIIDSPLLWRYFAGHPVEFIESAFFFVGMAILVLRLANTLDQRSSLQCVSLGPLSTNGQPLEECHRLLTQLGKLPQNLQRSYFVQRLRKALEFIQRKQSANDLDGYLRHLEELDAAQLHSGYATLRIIIWAIPILGFLGTVIGITVAIANLSPTALEQSMSEVTQGLGVAFDTTAQALALTMVLMFAKSLVERVEDRLLSVVDARTSEELVGRFQQTASIDDPHLETIHHMSRQLIQTMETLTVRQAELWKQSIDETHQQWADVNIATAQIVKHSLSKAIQENLEQHARILGQNVLRHADQLNTMAANHVDKLERGAQQTVARLREGLERLGDLLVEALHRHGEVLTQSERELAEANRQHLLTTMDLLTARLTKNVSNAESVPVSDGESVREAA